MRTLRVLVGVVLIAVGCRGLAGIDDKRYVADPSTGGSSGSGGATSSAASSSTTSSSSGTGGSCGAPDDAQNCGACGHDCEGGECKDGVCQPYTLAYVSPPNHLSGLAVPGDGFLYFGNEDQKTVRRAADGVANQGDAALVAGVPFSIRNLRIDGKNVYFSSSNAFQATPVYVANKSGGAAVALDGAYYLQFGLAGDGTDLYVTDSAIGCRVVRVPRDGSAAVEVFYDPAGDCNGVAVDDTHVYFTDMALGRVLRIAKSAPGADAGSAQPEEIETGTVGAFPVVVDATHVYWATKIELLRKPKDGSGATETLAMFSSGPYTAPTMLVLDGGYVYYVTPGYDGGTGTIARVSNEIPAPLPETMAKGLYGASHLVVTKYALYWIEQFQYRITKMVR